MSGPSIGQLLANTLSPNAQDRSHATQQLEQFSTNAFADYILALATELANSSSASHIRNAAGLAIKNSLTAKETSTRDLYAARWAAVPEATRQTVKQTALSSLSSPDRAIRNVAAQVVAAIAALELPQNAWPNLIADLLALSTQSDNAPLRQAALQTIGFICESIVGGLLLGVQPFH
jgi:importin subunit beta-1